MEYELFYAPGFFTVLSFVLIYFIDEKVKYLYNLNIRKTKLITLKRTKFLFAYPRRGGKVVTSFVISCMITLYVITLSGLTLLALYFVTGTDTFFEAAWLVLLLNSFLFMRVMMFVHSLNGEQREILIDDLQLKKQRKLGLNDDEIAVIKRISDNRTPPTFEEYPELIPTVKKIVSMSRKIQYGNIKKIKKMDPYIKEFKEFVRKGIKITDGSDYLSDLEQVLEICEKLQKSS